MHDPTKCVLGGVKSSYREVTSEPGVVPAGIVAHRASDGTISEDSADGVAIGISVGKTLDGLDTSSVCREGLGVPLILEGEFEPVIGEQVYYHDTTGEAVAHDDGDAVATNATWASEALTGLQEDGTEVSVAYVDMPGGL